MLSPFKFDRITLIAFLFLMAGAARPAVILAESFLPRESQDVAMCSDDLEDGEEKGDTTDNESDTEDDVFKIMAKGMTIGFSPVGSELSRKAYSLVFKEHHPEIVTPPPKS